MVLAFTAVVIVVIISLHPTLLLLLLVMVGFGPICVAAITTYHTIVRVASAASVAAAHSECCRCRIIIRRVHIIARGVHRHGRYCRRRRRQQQRWMRRG